MTTKTLTTKRVVPTQLNDVTKSTIRTSNPYSGAPTQNPQATRDKYESVTLVDIEDVRIDKPDGMSQALDKLENGLTDKKPSNILTKTIMKGKLPLRVRIYGRLAHEGISVKKATFGEGNKYTIGIEVDDETVDAMNQLATLLDDKAFDGYEKRDTFLNEIYYTSLKISPVDKKRFKPTITPPITPFHFTHDIIDQGCKVMIEAKVQIYATVSRGETVKDPPISYCCWINYNINNIEFSYPDELTVNPVPSTPDPTLNLEDEEEVLQESESELEIVVNPPRSKRARH